MPVSKSILTLFKFLFYIILTDQQWRTKAHLTGHSMEKVYLRKYFVSLQTGTVQLTILFTGTAAYLRSRQVPG